MGDDNILVVFLFLLVWSVIISHVTSDPNFPGSLSHLLNLLSLSSYILPYFRTMHQLRLVLHFWIIAYIYGFLTRSYLQRSNLFHCLYYLLVRTYEIKRLHPCLFHCPQSGPLAQARLQLLIHVYEMRVITRGEVSNSPSLFLGVLYKPVTLIRGCVPREHLQNLCFLCCVKLGKGNQNQQ